MTAAAAERRLHPATLVGGTLQIIPQAAGGMAGFGAIVAEAGLARVLMLAALGIVLAAAMTLLAWWRFRYIIGSGEIVIQSGILHRQRRVIPFDRVQDIAIERGPLARLFGTARVRIETGGSAKDEGQLDQIGLADAHELRDIIRRWNAQRGGEAQAEAPGPEPEEPVLFAMPLGRVLLSGIFNFSLVFIAALFALLQYLEPLTGPLLEEPQRWLGPAEEAAERATAAALLILLTVLLLLGVVSGVVRTLARDYGFRLTRSAAGLRRRRGLLTLSEVVIPIHRVQAGLIESGLVGRALGRYRLRLQTLGAEQGEGGSQMVAPFASMEELAPILVEAGLPVPPAPEAWVRSPGRSFLRRAFTPAVLALAAALAAAAVDPRAGIGAGLLVLAAAAAAPRWRVHAHALEEGTLFVRDGLLKRRLWIVPAARVQTISVVRSPLQRALGLASLLPDTAGGSPVRYPQAVDLYRRDAEALADRLRGLLRGRGG